MYADAAVHQISAPLPATAEKIRYSDRDQRVSAFAKQEMLFCEGDKADNIYEVVDGVVSTYRILCDGRRQVFEFSYPGDLVGLGNLDAYPVNCEAVTPSRIRRIPKNSFLKSIKERPELGRKMLEIAMSELSAMQNHFVLLGRKTALEKIASFLLDFARRNVEPDARSATLDLPMTRSDIADYLGLTVETVSRNLTKLKLRGVIDLPQSANVVIRDMFELEDLAEGDEDTV